MVTEVVNSRLLVINPSEVVRLTARWALKKDAKHVVVIMRFAKDESSILSTSKIQIKPNQITLSKSRT